MYHRPYNCLCNCKINKIRLTCRLTDANFQHNLKPQNKGNGNLNLTPVNRCRMRQGDAFCLAVRKCWRDSGVSVRVPSASLALSTLLPLGWRRTFYTFTTQTLNTTAHITFPTHTHTHTRTHTRTLAHTHTHPTCKQTTDVLWAGPYM